MSFKIRIKSREALDKDCKMCILNENNKNKPSEIFSKKLYF
jgi:hypothetical protein